MQNSLRRTVSASDSALARVIIDMINAFTHKYVPLCAPFEDQISAVSPPLEAAQGRGHSCFFSAVEYGYDDLRDAGILAQYEGHGDAMRRLRPGE
ncbi:MAG: hypothetical protein VYE18_09230 [Pseudomonadota bacterium]|nr:hypothetical protein [Pseudomonadota bacterium]